MQYIYTKNQFLPADSAFITTDDRSFRFGDGIFETILVVNGNMWDADAHFARLKDGLEFFSLALDISKLEEECNTLIARNSCKAGYVRIIVSRGDSAGIVGYMPAGGAPYYIIQTVEKAFPPFGSISLAVSRHRASLHIPCKTNSAMLYTLAMLEAKEAGCENALILNSEGHVCETASGNIFWVKDGVLYTPESSLPFVPGTVRKRVIELSPLPVNQGRYTLAELAAAEEIFMTNIGGLVTRVSSIPAIGFSAKTDAAAQRFRQLIEHAVRS